MSLMPWVIELWGHQEMQYWQHECLLFCLHSIRLSPSQMTLSDAPWRSWIFKLPVTRLILHQLIQLHSTETSKLPFNEVTGGYPYKGTIIRMRLHAFNSSWNGTGNHGVGSRSNGCNIARTAITTTATINILYCLERRDILRGDITEAVLC